MRFGWVCVAGGLVLAGCGTAARPPATTTSAASTVATTVTTVVTSVPVESSTTTVPASTTTALPVNHGVAIGDYQGASLAEVTALLAASGIQIHTVYTPVPFQGLNGLVIAQAPAARTVMVPGSVLNLTVGKYLSTSGTTTVLTVTVPDLVGLNRAQVDNSLQGDGLAGRYSTQATTTPASNGLVLSQSPSPGSLVPAGSTVSVVIGTDPGKPA